MKLALIVLACLLHGSHQNNVEIESSIAPAERFLSTITKTSTLYSKITSTFTSAKFATCIPSSFFVSTTACRRKRAIMEESGIEELIPSELKQ